MAKEIPKSTHEFHAHTVDRSKLVKKIDGRGYIVITVCDGLCIEDVVLEEPWENDVKRIPLPLKDKKAVWEYVKKMTTENYGWKIIPADAVDEKGNIIREFPKDFREELLEYERLNTQKYKEESQLVNTVVTGLKSTRSEGRRRVEDKLEGILRRKGLQKGDRNYDFR